MTKTKIKDLVNKVLKDPKTDWKDSPEGLRAFIDVKDYPDFLDDFGRIGFEHNGNPLSKIRASVTEQGSDIVVENLFPSATSGL